MNELIKVMLPWPHNHLSWSDTLNSQATILVQMKLNDDHKIRNSPLNLSEKYISNYV